MAVVFSTLDWSAFESKVTTDTTRLAKLVAGRVGKSTLDPERLLTESMQDPSAAHIEYLMAKSVWYSNDTTDDHAAYDAITMTLLMSPKLAKEFKNTCIDDAYVDFGTLSLTAVTIPPGTKKLNPFSGDIVELEPRVSISEKCGLNLKSFPFVLGRRYRSELTDHDPDSQFGIHSPSDVSEMLDECTKLISVLKKSKERNAASMAAELDEGFTTALSEVAGPNVGLFTYADT